MRDQPVPQPQQIPGERGELSQLGDTLPTRPGYTYAHRHHVLVHVDPCTPLDYNLHRLLPRLAVVHRTEESPNRNLKHALKAAIMVLETPTPR